LGDNDADQAHDGVLAVLADDDHEGGGEHGDNVDDEEEVCDACRNCGESLTLAIDSRECSRISAMYPSLLSHHCSSHPNLPVRKATDLGLSTYYAYNHAGTPADRSIASKCATHLPGK
jgi:hypothetical protein